MITDLRKQVRLFHRPTDLFDLVSDVKRYPEFIPQITAMQILSREERDDVLDFKAQARIRYKFVTERFTSHVIANAGAGRIQVGFVSGPFRVLENNWHFHRLSDGSTLVDFQIRAAFKNNILQVLLDRNRDRAASVIMDSFIGEARRRYPHEGQQALSLDDEINALVENL